MVCDQMIVVYLTTSNIFASERGLFPSLARSQRMYLFLSILERHANVTSELLACSAIPKAPYQIGDKNF